MSYWSTLKSIFRTPKLRPTRLTMSIVFQDGSSAFDFPVSLPEYVVTMLQRGAPPLRVVIWKHFEPPPGIMPENMVPYPLCHLSHFPLNRPRVVDGSLAMKLEDCGRLQ